VTPTTLLAQFFDTVPNPADTDVIMYDVLEYTSRLARLAARYGRPNTGQMPVRSTVTYKGVTVKELIRIPPELMDARALGSLSESAREQIVAQALQSVRMALDRRLEWLRAQWLTAGALLNSDGAVPNTSLGTAYIDYPGTENSTPIAVDLGWSASHIATTVSASWATSSTDIRSDLQDAAHIVERDTGVYPRTVLLNSNTMNYILDNDNVTNTDEAKAEIFRNGTIRNLWGFEFVVYDATWAIDTITMNDSAGTEYFIPDDLVVLLDRNNTVAGRKIVECKPDDLEAPVGHRGVYIWQDQQEEHPHLLSQGITWTGGPIVAVPDTMFVFYDVTAT